MSKLQAQDAHISIGNKYSLQMLLVLILLQKTSNKELPPVNKKPLSGRHSSPHWFVVSASMSALAALGQTVSNNIEARVEDILSRMTLDQKLSYIDGTPFFD